MSAPAAPVPDARRARGVRVSRRTAVLGLLLLGLVALLTAVPTWLTSAGSTAIEARVAIAVTGTKAAPGVAAGALVVAAGALALGIVGRIGRFVVPVVTAVAGVVVVGAGLGVVRDPRPVALRAAADSTGVTVLTEPVHVALWPWLTVVLGALVVLVSAIAVLGSSDWTVSTRHERAGVVGAAGAGPTAAGGAAARAEPAPTVDVDDPHAVWDSLSRGEDPTEATGPDGPTDQPDA